MIERFLNHKKSILSNQIPSIVGPSYWLTTVWSSSLTYWAAVYVETASGAIIIQHACTHNCLKFHSKLEANSKAFFTFSSVSKIVCNSSYSTQLAIISFKLTFSGMRFVIWLDLSKGIPNALAESLNAAFVAIFIKVQIEHTFSCPYFWVQ